MCIFDCDLFEGAGRQIGYSNNFSILRYYGIDFTVTFAELNSRILSFSEMKLRRK